MAWWGKIVGGTLGFLVGGPLGALLGAAIGHNFDGDNRRRIGHIPRPGDQERTQAAFFTATFSIMGYIAKADGHVHPKEIAMANAVMREMSLDEQQRRVARDLFNQGKQSGFDFEGIVDQFRVECHRRTSLIQMFIEIQVQAALADDHLHLSQHKVLRTLAARLGFSPVTLERIIDLVRGSKHAHEPDQQFGLNDAYAILGVTSQTPIDDIKRAYRRLRSQHHPDKLVSKGLPEEMIKLANEKMIDIQAAWDKINESHSTK